MKGYSIPLKVPRGLRERELEDWFKCSKDVRRSIVYFECLNRRRFLCDSVGAGFTATCVGSLVGSSFLTRQAQAQPLTLIAAIISSLQVIVQAIGDLQLALRPKEKIPATEKLQSNPSDPQTRYGMNLFSVIDEDTLRAETAAASVPIVRPVLHIVSNESINSPKLEKTHELQLSDNDWDFDDRLEIDVAELPLYANSAGVKRLYSLTEPHDANVRFRVEE